MEGSNVYWASTPPGTAEVGSVPVGGGSATTLVRLGSGAQPLSIAVDATNAYVAGTTCGGPLGCTGWIDEISLSSGATTTLASNVSVSGPIAVDGKSLYWTSSGGEFTGTVMSVPIAGGSPTTLASNQSWPGAIAVDATNAYWANGNGTIMKMPIGGDGGGAPSVLAYGQTGAAAITVYGANVYWVTAGTCADNGTCTGTVMTVPVAGAASPTTLASEQNTPAGIAVDGTNVYWTNSNSLMKVPIGGGAPIELGAQGGSAVVLDATNVYWLSGPAVVQLAK